MIAKTKEILLRINFSNRYINLCNAYSSIDNGKKFIKEEILDQIELQNEVLKFSTKEKLFYQDYTYDEFTFRFLIDYKYGFIDCMYIIWDKNQNRILQESFRGISQLTDSDFERKVSYRFPIATSLEDLKEIFDEVFNLLKDFKTQLKDI